MQTLNLGGCKVLEQLPDLSGLTSLQTLDLSRCEALEQLPDLSGLTSLQTLNLGGCKALKELSLSGLTSLETLNLSCCIALEQLPDLSGLTRLQTLNLGGCKALKELSLSDLASLQTLNLSCCIALKELPDLSGLTSLQTLDLGGCEALEQLPDLSGLTSLQTLNLGGCKALEQLSLSGLTSLETLNLGGCKALKELPDLSGLTRLQTLNLSGCRVLEQLPDLSGLTSLQTLNLSGCEALEQLSLSGLTSLQTLNLGGCKALKELSLSGLTSLQTLNLGGCKALEQLSLSGLTSLQTLNLSDCWALKQLPDLSGLTSLQTLDLSRCRVLKELRLSGLTSLQTLNPSGCGINVLELDLATTRIIYRLANQFIADNFSALPHDKRQTFIKNNPWFKLQQTLTPIEGQINSGEQTEVIEASLNSIRDQNNYVDYLKEALDHCPNITSYLIQNHRDDLIDDLEKGNISLEALPMENKLALLPLFPPKTVAEVISKVSPEEKARWLQQTISYDRFDGTTVDVLRKIKEKNIDNTTSDDQNIGITMRELLGKIPTRTFAALAENPDSADVALGFTSFMDETQLAVTYPLLTPSAFVDHVKGRPIVVHKNLLAMAQQLQKQEYIDKDVLIFPDLQKWKEKDLPALEVSIGNYKGKSGTVTMEQLKKDWSVIVSRMNILRKGDRNSMQGEFIVSGVEVGLKKYVGEEDSFQKVIGDYITKKKSELTIAQKEFLEKAKEINALIEASGITEVPDEFFDPITALPMKDPYSGPGGITIDKSTFDRFVEEGRPNPCDSRETNNRIQAQHGIKTGYRGV